MAANARLTDFVHVDVDVRGRASGGPAVLYWGPDGKSGQRWRALKMLKPVVWLTATRARDRFINEALTWMSIWPHANLVTAEEIIPVANQLCIILPYATRGNLREYMREGLSLDDALYCAQMIAAGLDALHTPDPDLHRDWIAHSNLKPENVLIHESGLAQLSDIGFANILNHRSGHLTLLEYRGSRRDAMAYRAPEQWSGLPKANRKADMYAFGIILCELLTGRHPLCDLDSDDTLSRDDWRTLHEQACPRTLRAGLPALPDSVERLYQRCLSRRPATRPTAHEALAVLQKAARQLGLRVYIPREVMPRTPEHKIAIWAHLAAVFTQFGCTGEALQYVTSLLALDPGNPAALGMRAILLARRGRTG